jgi:hypothetical protein
VTPYPIFHPTNTTHSDHNRTDDHDYLGDEMILPKPTHITRMTWQNINGTTTKANGSSLRQIFEEQQRIESDFRGLIEHKCDTTKHFVRQKFHDQIRKVFGARQYKLELGSSTLSSATERKPGGTLSSVVGNMSGRWTQGHTDPLGRWTYQTFEGKNKRLITCITAYAPTKPENRTGFATWHQQETLLSQQHRQNTHPPTNFCKDLQSLIKHLQDNHHLIILGGDFNESLSDPRSKMLSLAMSCNLIDPWVQTFPNQKPPRTFIGGTKQIDFILMSGELFPAVSAIGYSPFYTTGFSDHRNMFIDLDTSKLFGDPHAKLAQEMRRGINTKDRTTVREYLSAFHLHATNNNLFDKMKNLKDSSDANTDGLETIDRIIQQSCEYANDKCRPRHTPWYSQTLTKARLKVDGLRRLQSNYLRKNNDDTAIRSNMASQGVDLPPASTLPDIRQELRTARQELNRIIRQARETRDQEQQDAINRAATTGNRTTETILRQIKQAEHKQNMFRMFKNIRGNTKAQGVTKLEIPADWPLHTVPIDTITELSDPKTAREWRTVTAPDEMEFYLQLRNRLHFGQAQGTPFTSPPLIDLINWAADSAGATQILTGTLDLDTLQEVDETTKLLLHQCRTTGSLNALDCQLSMEEFSAKLKIWSEQTTTSPSGRHLGNYKALVARHSTSDKDPDYDYYDAIQKDIRQLHLDIINYCTKHCYVLDRWKDVTNIMIFKEPGNFKIHRLRVIHIYEADYNLLLSVKYRKLMFYADSVGTTHRGQHGGRPGHDATSLTLLEELKNDISYAARRILLNFDNDAASCYDRIIVALASLISRRFGQHSHIIWVNATTLEEARFKLKTGLGISERFYSHCVAFPIHGTGQGSGNSPVIWCFISSVLFETHETVAHGATFTSPDRTTSVHFSMVGFVDDSTSQTNSFHADPQPTPNEITVLATHDAQLWNDLLWSSGGLLELAKCSYHILDFQFDATGKPHPKGGILGDPIRLNDSLSNSTVEVTAKSAFEPHKTLGNLKAPAGNNQTQLTQIITRGTTISRLMATSPIDAPTAAMFFHSILAPSVAYPLPQSFFSYDRLDSAASKFMPLVFAKSGYNRTTSKEILYGPTSLAGGNFTHLYTIQGEGQLQHFMKFWRTESDISHMLRIDLAWCQAQAGISIPILENPTLDLPHLEARWLPSLRNFLADINATIEVDNPYIPPLQRTNDQFIMDHVLSSRKFTAPEIQQINYCRLYLRVQLLSDICTIDGTRIHPAILRGTRSPIATANDVPFSQDNPGFHQWILWRRVCRIFGTTDGTLYTPLGSWTVSGPNLRCTWESYVDLDGPFFYHRADNQWLRFSKQADGSFSNPSPCPGWTPCHHEIPTTATPLRINSWTLPPPMIRDSCPQHAVSVPETFDEYITALPDWERNLLAQIEFIIPPFELLHKLSSAPPDSEWHGLWVHDGSEIGASMSFGVTLTAHDDTKLLICSGPGYGHPSSHRAECYGCLAATRLCFHLLQFCRHPTSTPLTFKWVSDNAGMILRLTQRHEYKDPYPNSTLDADWDVIEEIFQTTKLIGGTHFYEHVKGHQDAQGSADNLSIEARANIDADLAAGEYNLFNRHPRPIVPRLPSNSAQIHIAHRTITSHLRAAVRQAVSYGVLQRKIEERYSWPRLICRTIDWPVLHSLCNRFTHTPIWRTKFVHNLLPTNSLRHRYDPSTCPDCILCGNTNEDFTHVLLCPHPTRAAWRAHFLTEVRHRADSLHSREALTTIIVDGLASFLNQTPFDTLQYPPSVSQLAHEQHRIGWLPFLRGHVSLLWSNFQDHHIATHKTKSPYNTGHLWIVNLLTTIWTEIKALWDLHNKEIHGFNHQEQEAATKTRLSREILYLHSRKRFVLSDDRDRFFLHDVPDFISKNHSTTLQNWITNYRPAIMDSERTAQATAVSNTRSLTYHFPRTNPASPTRTRPRYNPRLHAIHDHTRKKKRRPMTRPQYTMPITRYFPRNHIPLPPTTVDDCVVQSSPSR